MEISTPNLWQKVKKGNIKAFETIYKSYFPSLCLYSYGLIPDEEFVKEIVNDVFLKLWDKRTDIEIQYGIKPYLFRCVHNACLDHMRLKKNVTQYHRTDITDKIRELADHDEEYIFQQIALKGLEEDVTISIDQLPDRCKEIFILSRYELLSYIEISERLNISVNTVKTQISRALDSLRVSLKKYL
ncbi:MAG: RNA polymerase sigma-70 factor [Bacteroidales bacterium]